jgi:hypothetical protein
MDSAIDRFGQKHTSQNLKCDSYKISVLLMENFNAQKLAIRARNSLSPSRRPRLYICLLLKIDTRCNLFIHVTQFLTRSGIK